MQTMIVTEPRRGSARKIRFNQTGTGCRQNGKAADEEVLGYRKTGEVFDADMIRDNPWKKDGVNALADDEPEAGDRLSDPDDWIDVSFMAGFELAEIYDDPVHEIRPSSRQNEGFDPMMHRADLSD